MREGRKLARVYVQHALLEELLTANRNDFISTNCPGDLKILAVEQDDTDKAHRQACLLVESKEAKDWPEVKPGEQVPILMPFVYEVIEPEPAAAEPGEDDGK